MIEEEVVQTGCSVLTHLASLARDGAEVDSVGDVVADHAQLLTGGQLHLSRTH